MKNNLSQEKWPTFSEILQRLHQEGIYIHSEQLAEFFLAHGIPVDLRYVPDRLKRKAMFINENYQGDMACLGERREDEYDDFTQYW